MVNRCVPGGVSRAGSSPSARAAHVGEVRPPIVHVIVHPEDYDVVGGQVVALLAIERVRVDDGDVVAIVPERGFVRQDHVQTRGHRALNGVEAVEQRTRAV